MAIVRSIFADDVGDMPVVVDGVPLLRSSACTGRAVALVAKDDSGGGDGGDGVAPDTVVGIVAGGLEVAGSLAMVSPRRSLEVTVEPLASTES